MTASVARVAGAAAKVLAAAAALTLVLAILVNLRDEEISAEARAMARYEPPAAAVTGNAYVALLGLSAPADADPQAVGARLIAARPDEAGRDPFARERAPRPKRDGDEGEDEPIAFNGDPDSGCALFDEPCLAFAKTRAGAIRALLADNALLIERYLEALQLPAFAATPIADQRRADFERRNLDRVLGKHLPLYVDYVAHAHGVAAYVALVRAQLELKLAAVPFAEVPRFLERADPAAMNPFDGRPFRWDGERRTLSFDPPARRWRRWGATAAVAAPGPAAAAAAPTFATMAVR